MFCLKKSGTQSAAPGGKAKRGAGLGIEPLQHANRDQNPEAAVAVVLGVGHDAVDAQNRERQGVSSASGHAAATRPRSETSSAIRHASTVPSPPMIAV